MPTDALPAPRLPSPSQIRAQVLAALGRYWVADVTPVAGLPVPTRVTQPLIEGPLRLVAVQLPPWAADCAVVGELLVPREVLPPAKAIGTDAWQQVDWHLAAFLLLEGWHERLWEHRNGPIHSYSFRLKGWDERAWQHAWVNRIGLFLRLWAIHREGPAVERRLGELPPAEILMTHDVDAIGKTLPIRLKQGAFNLFNAARALRRAEIRQASDRFRQATRFLFGREDWWTFDDLLALEQAAGIRATFHFHADPRRKTPRRWLFDPGYDIRAPRLRALLRQIQQAGHHVGLHPGFESWQSPTAIAAARNRVAQAAESPVTHARQHWLRFSWRDTWAAQATAGLWQDTTLMFNDRPGFRTSSSLAWRPWNPAMAAAHGVTVQPTLLMDSHCYDYQPMTPHQRRQTLRTWLGECQAVRGQAAVLWHPHTLTQDYGWSSGFQEALALLKETRT